MAAVLFLNYVMSILLKYGTNKGGNMYYSAWDKQCQCYFHTGRNSNTRQECLEDICEYLTDEPTDEDYTGIPLEDILIINEVEIHAHKDLIGQLTK